MAGNGRDASCFPEESRHALRTQEARQHFALAKNAISSPPPNWLPIRGTGETCNAAEAATRSTAELQVHKKTRRELHPRPRRCERRNRLLHHRIGIGFVGERSRTGQAIIIARPFGSEPASRRFLRIASTVRCMRRLDSNQLFPERSIRALHHRQTVFRGTSGAALLFSKTKKSAPSPPELKLSFKRLAFPHDEGFGEAGNKNPSGAVSSGGVRNVEHLKWDQPISPPRESARASTSPQPVGLCVVSVGWMNVLKLCIVLSHLRMRLPQAKGRVYDLRSWRRQGESRANANFVLEVMGDALTFAT